MTKEILTIVVGLLILAVAYGGWKVYDQNKMANNVACTADAKLCPDGSAVGRVGPNCEFAACPMPPTVSSVTEVKFVIDGLTATQFGQPTIGDIDGDGVADAGLWVTTDGGGSGTFFYVAVALGAPGGYRSAGALFAGDRIAPQVVEIKNGMVIGNFAERKPGEPMTTRPSEGRSLYGIIVDGTLVPRP